MRDFKSSFPSNYCFFCRCSVCVCADAAALIDIVFNVALCFSLVSLFCVVLVVDSRLTPMFAQMASTSGSTNDSLHHFNLSTHLDNLFNNSYHVFNLITVNISRLSKELELFVLFDKILFSFVVLF